MDHLHLIDLPNIPWQPHPTLAGVLIKVVENRASHPLADVVLAQVLPGGKIPWHVHEQASETAYIVQGAGHLRYAPAQSQLQTFSETALTTGAALTIQAGLWHSVVNSGDEALILFAFHTPPTF